MFSKVMLAFLILEELRRRDVADEGSCATCCAGRVEGSVARIGLCRMVSLYVGCGMIGAVPGTE